VFDGDHIQDAAAEESALAGLLHEREFAGRAKSAPIAVHFKQRPVTELVTDGIVGLMRSGFEFAFRA